MALKTYETIAEIKAEITEEQRAHWIKGIQDNEEIPEFLKGSERIKEMYVAANWLAYKLADAGCPDAEAESICFAHGQRSAFGNTWVAAGQAWNAYVEGRAEHGGPELAEKIFNEQFKVIPKP